MIQRHAKKAGLTITISPHTFRRTCTTEMLRGGAGMYHVKELLGHESLDTLKHYAPSAGSGQASSRSPTSKPHMPSAIRGRRTLR